MRILTRGFGKLGNLFKSLFKETGKDSSTLIIVDESGNPLANAVIEISSYDNKYKYTAVTDSNGEVEINGSVGHKYILTLAKSGIEQYTIIGWKFTEQDTIEFPQVAKQTYDGMYADTDSRMYVDTLDGGNS